jgi:acyl-CoA reductase-like NAD-dependent aldehyde dehydrogenase
MHQGGTTLHPDDNGAFVKPTIFIDVKHDDEINTEEVFGPVAVIHRFSKGIYQTRHNTSCATFW